MKSFEKEFQCCPIHLRRSDSPNPDPIINFPPTQRTPLRYSRDNWVWTREMEIISSSKVHKGTIVVCWVLIMVRSDLTGMLIDSTFKPVSCGPTISAWLEEFNLWPLRCDIIRNTERINREREKERDRAIRSITGTLQLNNSRCADDVLVYLSHRSNMYFPCRSGSDISTVSHVQHMLNVLLTFYHTLKKTCCSLNRAHMHSHTSWIAVGQDIISRCAFTVRN